jgi:hypothetical protein
MPTYRATILDKQKRPLLRTTFDAFSEPEAMERARHIAHGREVEIERLVILWRISRPMKKADGPPNTSDSQDVATSSARNSASARRNRCCRPQ